MGAPKKTTHTIQHGKTYLMVDGKLTLIEKGTEVVLTDEQSSKLGKKVKPITETKKIDATKQEPAKES